MRVAGCTGGQSRKMVGSARHFLRVDGTTVAISKPAALGRNAWRAIAHATTSNDPRLPVGCLCRQWVAAWQSPRIAGTRRPSRTGRQQNAAQPAQNPQPFPPEAMDELLRQWEGQSAKLDTLEVDIYRIDRTWPGAMRPISRATPPSRAPIWPTSTIAQVKLQSTARPQGQEQEDVRSRMQKNGQLVSKPFETILCTGTEVWHYRSDVKRLIILPLDNERAGKRPSTRARCPSSSG